MIVLVVRLEARLGFFIRSARTMQLFFSSLSKSVFFWEVLSSQIKGNLPQKGCACIVACIWKTQKKWITLLCARFQRSSRVRDIEQVSSSEKKTCAPLSYICNTFSFFSSRVYVIYYFQLLDKPRGHRCRVPSSPPPGSCLQFLSRIIGFSNPSARRFVIEFCV